MVAQRQSTRLQTWMARVRLPFTSRTDWPSWAFRPRLGCGNISTANEPEGDGRPERSARVLTRTIAETRWEGQGEGNALRTLCSPRIPPILAAAYAGESEEGVTDAGHSYQGHVPSMQGVRKRCPEPGGRIGSSEAPRLIA